MSDKVEVCSVCFRNVWDCTCHHDSIETEQFLRVGPITAEKLYEIRREDEREDEERDAKKQARQVTGDPAVG